MLRDLFSLFPAYAGVILLQKQQHNERGPFPRIRGGDPFFVGVYFAYFFFSPHTRG